MHLCSWCFSDSATRSDDEVDPQPGPSKSSQATIEETKDDGTVPSPKPPSIHKIYDKYASEIDSDRMSEEGFETFCGDAHIPMDGPMPLLLSWQFKGKELFQLTREEWSNGVDELA